ncbi:MAG TPA: TraX family protein [Leptolyngbyaceae cyanobacterium]
MTSFHIKILAATLMAIDHIGAVFFPDILAFRIIGRLSFPLFAWLIGQGEKYTKNFNLYLFRLIILGIATQPIYYLLFNIPRPNILATLALGLIAIRLDKITKLKFLFTFIFALLAELINSEYGAYGVLMISILSNFNPNHVYWVIQWILLSLSPLILLKFPDYQLFAIFTPLILINYNGEPGKKAKWFYLFYPVHFAILYLVNVMITNS